jgi:ABC-type transport system substrate-binding protein
MNAHQAFASPVSVAARDFPLVCEIDVLEPCLDPAHIYDFVADGIAGLLHDTLFRADGQDGLAAGWRASGRDWTIDLARDHCFADGTQIRAAHVADAIRTLTRVGARRWIAAAIEDVAATGPHRLAIRTTRPIGYLRELLTVPAFAPRAPDPANGSGPYRLAKALPDRRGLLLRRDGPSPRARGAGPKWLSLLRTDDAAQGIRLFHQGRIQLSCGTTFPHRCAADPALAPALQVSRSTLAGQLLPHAARLPGLADPVARQALSLAIDRNKIAAGLAPVIEPWHDFASLWDDADSVPAAEPDAARAAWVEADRPPRRIEITYADFPPNGELLAAVADQIECTLPLRVTLRALDYPAYVGALAAGDYELAYAILPPAFADPSAALLPFATPGALPYGPAAPAAFLAAFTAAEAIGDAARRRRAMAMAAALLMQAMPVIPLVRTRICQLVADGIIVPMLPGGLPDYARIRNADG